MDRRLTCGSHPAQLPQTAANCRSVGALRQSLGTPKGAPNDECRTPQAPKLTAAGAPC